MSQLDPREWKLVAGTEAGEPSVDAYIKAGKQGKLPPRPKLPRWFVFEAPPVPESETVLVVPKSSLLAQRQRADEAERERDYFEAKADSWVETANRSSEDAENLTGRADQAEAKVRELEGVLADLLAITRSARPREQHRRAVVLRAVRALSPDSQGEK